MRVEKTTVILQCDNCRVTSEEREGLPIDQLWYKPRLGNNTTLSFRYDTLFCSEDCGQAYVKKNSTFDEVPKNALREALRVSNTYARIGNTD